ncbi:hypothetical protein PsYK624_115890 [Phanerochaete sordida]|uniref:Uncharacterized protein n=1 Tax=Phanerochaete sordida TaxID=48140 RepID=A0A9P3GI01_9APHY|nr:hypothetical protein PsYK624_115890 [Phanerochaete sordida]
MVFPCFVGENKVKPKATLVLEETDVGRAPVAFAAHVLRGLRAGRFYIAHDSASVGHVACGSTRGAWHSDDGTLDLVYFGMIYSLRWQRDVISGGPQARRGLGALRLPPKEGAALCLPLPSLLRASCFGR